MHALYNSLLFLAFSILSFPLCKFRDVRLLSERLTTCKFFALLMSKSLKRFPWRLILKNPGILGTVLGSSLST